MSENKYVNTCDCLPAIRVIGIWKLKREGFFVFERSGFIGQDIYLSTCTLPHGYKHSYNESRNNSLNEPWLLWSMNQSMDGFGDSMYQAQQTDPSREGGCFKRTPCLRPFVRVGCGWRAQYFWPPAEKYPTPRGVREVKFPLLKWVRHEWVYGDWLLLHVGKHVRAPAFIAYIMPLSEWDSVWLNDWLNESRAREGGHGHGQGHGQACYCCVLETTSGLVDTHPPR